MLRGALIGLGNIATRGHVPAFATDLLLQSKVKIVAVMDVVESNREKMREYLPGAKFYADIATLLSNEQLDFVDICTPPHTHREYILAAATQGVHVVCEKPLTEQYQTSIELIKQLGTSRIVFVPCHQYKYSPLWKSIHEFISSGTLGNVSFAQFNVFRLQADSGTAAWNPEWRTNRKQSGGGILVDTGAHYFYLTQYFFGMPRRVSSIMRTLKHADYGVEDTAAVMLEYDKTLVQLNLTWAASARANSASVLGTNGSLVYDGEKLLHASSKGVQEIPMLNISDKSQYIGWYASLFKEFLRRIEEKDLSNDLLSEAGNVMKLLDISYRSSEQHAIIDCV